MKKEQNIINEVLEINHFNEQEKNKFKKMLEVVNLNKLYGVHHDTRREIQNIIERDDLDAN